ncbi:hypothetical protein Tco_0554289 [Tanacetum coccineum]
MPSRGELTIAFMRRVNNTPSRGDLTTSIGGIMIYHQAQQKALDDALVALVDHLEHTGDITYLTDVNVDYLHQPWRAFATVINKCLSGKETGMNKIRLSRAQILWGMFHKKNIDYVYLLWEDKADSDTSPKKKPVQATKGTILKTSAKGCWLPKEARLNFTALMQGGSGDGVDTQSKVPDEQQQKVTESEEESWTFSQDDEDAEEESDKNDDSEETRSNNDGDDLTYPNLSTYKAEDQEEEKADEEEKEEKTNDEEVSSDQKVSTPPDYELTKEEENKEDDDKDKEGKQEEEEEDELYRDLNINLERSDAEILLLTQNQGHERYHFDQRVSALESEMSKFRKQLQTNKLREEAQADNQEFLNQVTESLRAKVLVRSTNQPQTSYAVAASLSEFKLKKILIDKMETNKLIDRSDTQKNLYNALVKSYNTNKDIVASYDDVVTLKRGRDDQDKDEDPSAGSNRGSKRRRSGKEAESSKEPKNKESKSTSSSKSASKSQLKSSGKSAHAEEHDQMAADLEDQPHQEFNTGYEDESPARETLNEDVWHRNPSRPPTPDHEWHKTKITKAVDYGQVKWIEDKVSRIWSPIKVIYDKHTYWGTYHWGPKRHKFYGYASNMETSKDVYSRHRIITDDQLYKFQEGDFKRLRRQDIEDMLLFFVQDKQTNLNLEEEDGICFEPHQQVLVGDLCDSLRIQLWHWKETTYEVVTLYQSLAIDAASSKLPHTRKVLYTLGSWAVIGLLKDLQELLRKLLEDLQIISEELADYINTLNWNCPAFYEDDDDEYTIQYREYLENSSSAITLDLPTEEPDNSLSMGDEHLSTILETKSDEVIKSSVEDLVPIPSESEGISDDTRDVPFCDNSPPLDVLNDHFEILSDFNDD